MSPPLGLRVIVVVHGVPFQEDSKHRQEAPGGFHYHGDSRSYGSIPCLPGQCGGGVRLAPCPCCTWPANPRLWLSLASSPRWPATGAACIDLPLLLRKLDV